MLGPFGFRFGPLHQNGADTHPAAVVRAALGTQAQTV